jgi:hypothetical protein
MWQHLSPLGRGRRPRDHSLPKGDDAGRRVRGAPNNSKHQGVLHSTQWGEVFAGSFEVSRSSVSASHRDEICRPRRPPDTRAAGRWLPAARLDRCSAARQAAPASLLIEQEALRVQKRPDDVLVSQLLVLVVLLDVVEREFQFLLARLLPSGEQEEFSYFFLVRT